MKGICLFVFSTQDYFVPVTGARVVRIAGRIALRLRTCKCYSKCTLSEITSIFSAHYGERETSSPFSAFLFVCLLVIFFLLHGSRSATISLLPTTYKYKSMAKFCLYSIMIVKLHFREPLMTMVSMYKDQLGIKI